MEFPRAHHSQHHQHHDRENPPPGTSPYPSFDQPPPPPPPNLTHTSHTSYPQPPPPQNVTHAYPLTSFDQPPPPPPNFTHTSYPPSPPPPQNVTDAYSAITAHHVDHHNHHQSHQQHHHDEMATPAFAGGGRGSVTHHWHQRPLNSSGFINQHTHYSSESALAGLSNKPTLRVFSKANPNFSLAVRNAKVILEPYNPADIFQQWYKDEKYSTRVKDEQGYPSFSLVNKATGLAMKHSDGDTQPVKLAPFNPDVLDMSLLWTESKDLGGGYKAVRMVNNIHLNVDAYHGDKLSGGVHDGTIIVLWQWNSGDNQLWKIASH